MRICLECSRTLESGGWTCPGCGFAPEKIDGHLSFAPNLARQNSGFRSSAFKELARLEEGNFWFRSRNRLIISVIREFFSDARSFLEIGCGTGFVLSGIESAFPRMSLTGSELFSSGLSYAAHRVSKASLFQMDARSMPFVDEFDLVGAFDVLEHVPEDELVLQQIFQALRPSGGILLTVPQHPFLWSPVDERACHVRRYTASDLEGKVVKAGFRILRKTSFVCLLLPLMMLARLKKAKKSQIDDLTELRISGPLNSCLEGILGFERYLIRQGCRFPVGGSLLLAAQKD